MASNDEIMDMLKLILEKVEHLELKAHHISVNSDSVSIHATDGAIEIQEVADVLIQSVGERTKITIEKVDDLSVEASSANNVTIQCEGNISGDLSVTANEKPNIK